MTRSLACVLVLAALLALPAAPGTAATTARPGSAATPEPGPAATQEPDPADREEATESERRLAAELRELERAWADGGGTFGYPFWEKAGHRWLTGEITTPMYREYVTGYRDRLVVGCELLREVDVGSETGEEVQELVVSACERRVEALRAEQQSLDEQVRRDAEPVDEEIEAVEERIAELDEEHRAALQESYRDARLALDQAQAALDEAGLERLAEDAFI